MNQYHWVWMQHNFDPTFNSWLYWGIFEKNSLCQNNRHLFLGDRSFGITLHPNKIKSMQKIGQNPLTWSSRVAASATMSTMMFPNATVRSQPACSTAFMLLGAWGMHLIPLAFHTWKLSRYYQKRVKDRVQRDLPASRRTPDQWQRRPLLLPWGGNTEESARPCWMCWARCPVSSGHPHCTAKKQSTFNSCETIQTLSVEFSPTFTSKVKVGGISKV